MPNVPGPRRLALVSGAGALAISGLFAAHLAANTPQGAGAEPRLGRTARRLGLSDDQKQQIRGILKAHASEIEAQMKTAQSGRKSLRKAMALEPLDEGRVRHQALVLGEVRADGAVLRARIRSEIWPVLTPQQQEKAEELGTRKGQREKHRMDALGRWLRGGA